MAQSIAQAAQTALAVMGETGSTEPLTALMLASPHDVLAMLRALPPRLDDRQLAEVTQIANAPAIGMPRASAEHFAMCLRNLAILPRRADDDEKGDRRAVLYAKLLGDQPAEALTFMTKAALERCQWFPSIAECKTILAEWLQSGDGDTIKALAWSKAEAERQARFRDLCDAVDNLNQAEIDALPDRTKWALENKCALWRMPSGRWRVRAGLWADAVADDESTGGGDAKTSV